MKWFFLIGIRPTLTLKGLSGSELPHRCVLTSFGADAASRLRSSWTRPHQDQNRPKPAESPGRQREGGGGGSTGGGHVVALTDSRTPGTSSSTSTPSLHRPRACVSSGHGPAGSRMAQETRVIYHLEDQETPYLVRIGVPAQCVTLADFKQVLNRSNVRFFFKSVDEDVGWVTWLVLFRWSLIDWLWCSEKGRRHRSVGYVTSWCHEIHLTHCVVMETVSILTGPGPAVDQYRSDSIQLIN